jgi:hypothetical protein
VSIPIIVVNQSLMSLSRKISVVALLGLSTVMIICALIRVVGSLTERNEMGDGTAPVWLLYWVVVESSVSLIMASVIVIRGVFITNPVDDDRQKENRSFLQPGRRLLSILGFSRSSRSSRPSPQRSDSLHDQRKDPGAPRIDTQKLQGGTMKSVRSVIWGGKKHGQTQDDAMLSVDSAYSLGDIDYHNVRKAEVTKNKP